MPSLSDAILNGLSSNPDPASGAGAYVGGLAGQPATDPTAVMNAHQAQQGMAQITIPKNDRPPYFFRISMSNYSRSSWLEVGNLTPYATIELPLPTSLLDSHSVNWEQEPIGVSGALTMDAIGLVNGSGGGDASGLVRGAVRGAVGGLLNMFGRGSEAVGLGASQGLQAGLGYAINNYLTMMMQGPTYKTHKFEWKVSPNTPAESEEIQKLYVAINNAEAPTLSAIGSAFFKYPSIFQLSFEHKDGTDMGKTLYRFKPAVLRNSTWGFNPMGMAFYGETKAPESLQFGFDFVELEYWLGGQFK